MIFYLFLALFSFNLFSQELSLSDIESKQIQNLLKQDKKPELYHLNLDSSVPKTEVIVFVHGMKGHPNDFNYLIKQFKDTKYDVYIYVYDSVHSLTSQNGSSLAEALYKKFNKEINSKKNISIVAHSMGGLVTRHALNSLVVTQVKASEQFANIRVVAIDSPWHGFKAPSDKGLEKMLMEVVGKFMPNGFLDMRAEADCFIDDPKKKKISFLARPLPATYELNMVFAKNGHNALDYTEFPLNELTRKIFDYYLKGTELSGTPQQMNFWKAIKSSTNFYDFNLELRKASDEKKLTELFVIEMLKHFFPRFNGDHVSVLSDPELFKYIKQKLP